MNLPSNIQEKLYDDNWKKLEDLFIDNPNNLIDVFRFYYAIKNYILVNKDNVYESFVSFWKNNVLVHEDRITILNEIYEYAVVYKDLYVNQNVDISLTTTQIEIMKDFRSIHSLTVAPFVIAMYYHYKKGIISNENMFRILKLMNTYIIRREFANIKINDASRYFPQLLKYVNKETNGNYTSIYNVTLKYLVNMKVSYK